MLIVMKFGGSSLATADRIDNAARIIAKRREEGDDVVAVVSAQGGVTDKLVKKGLETPSGKTTCCLARGSSSRCRSWR